MSSSSSNCERYNFNVTEDDHLVCNILLGLQSLIHKSDPSPSNLSWATKRKRSALTPHPITHLLQINQQTHNKPLVDSNHKQRLHSPSSPLAFSPTQPHHHHTSHHSKPKSKKKKLKDWEEHVEKLKQTKEQLILTLDNVKKYQRTVLEFNIKLKAKRYESNVNLNVQTHQLPHQFPFLAQQQQQLEYTMQPSMTLYYPTPPFLSSNNGSGMRIMDGYSRLDDKALRASDARKRRRLQINEKKNSIAIRRLN